MGEADYADAEWQAAHPSNFRAAHRMLSDLKNVVIHCTDGRGDPNAVAQMWQVPGHASSAHFVIGQDGTIIQCVRLRDVAYHAHAANATSVGIEHCARSPGELGKDDQGLAVSDEQYAASAKLVAWLCYRAALKPDRDTIQGHAEIDRETTHADCPTRFTAGAPTQWDWQRFMQLVDVEYGKLSAPVA